MERGMGNGKNEMGNLKMGNDFFGNFMFIMRIKINSVAFIDIHAFVQKMLRGKIYGTE